MGCERGDNLTFSWENFVENIKGKNIVCYGAGVNASLMLMKEIFKPYLNNVLFFVDNNPKKVGTKFISDGKSFDIKSINVLDELSSDTIVLITISDYITIGEVLDQKGVNWFPWTIISTDLSFSQLKKQLICSDKNFFLLNTPDYMNLGDHAIAIAENHYLSKKVGKFIEIGSNSCHLDGLRNLREYVKLEDIIFVQGGGNMGSLWRVCEENIRNIIRTFPDNKIIIFPQSVYYGNSKEDLAYFYQSQEVYNVHKDLLICSRDSRSYDFVNKSYKCKSVLLPDIALTLEYNKKSKRNGIGLLLREDKEKFIKGDYQVVAQSVVKKLGKNLIHITHHPIDDPCNRQKRIDELLDVYSSCELVITDRLHGMILSIVTSTPCIVFDNSYCKISDLYKTWLKDCEYITLSEQLDENSLLDLIKEKIRYKYQKFDSEIYKKEFDKLTSYFNN